MKKAGAKANESDMGTGQQGNKRWEIWRGWRDPLSICVASMHERHGGKHRENSIKPKRIKH